MNRLPHIARISVFIVVLVLINVFARIGDQRWDMTQDQRYTLHPQIKELVSNSEVPIDIAILLEGDLTANFTYFRSYLDAYLGDLRRYADGIELISFDLLNGDEDVRKVFGDILSDRGLNPIARTVSSKQGVKQSLIFPFVIISSPYGVTVIDALDSKSPNQSEEDVLHQSMQSFPNKLFTALRKVTDPTERNVVIIGQNSRLVSEALNREKVQFQGYRFAPVDGLRWLQLRDSIKVDGFIALIGGEALTRQDYLAIDQAIVGEIPGLLMICKTDISLDSLIRRTEFYASLRDHMIEDQLFKWGVKINGELLRSPVNSTIPQVAGKVGGESNVIRVPFDYHPILTAENYVDILPVNKEVALYFPHSIDTIRTTESISRKVLISSGIFTSSQGLPAMINLNNLRLERDINDYERRHHILAIELNGKLNSLFSDRLTEVDRQLVGQQYLKESKGNSRIAIMGNLHFIQPMRDERGAYFPIGYNKWEDRMYEGNTFLVRQLLDQVQGIKSLEVKVESSNLSLVSRERFQQRILVYVLYFGFTVLLAVAIVYIIQYWRRILYIR